MVSHGSVRGLCLRRMLRSLNVLGVLGFERKSAVVSVNAKNNFPNVPLTVLLPRMRFRLMSDVKGGVGIKRTMTRTVNLGGIAFHRYHTRRRGRLFSFIIDHTIVPLTSLMGVTHGGVGGRRRGTLPGNLVYLGKKRLRRRVLPFRGRTIDLGLDSRFGRRFFRAGGIICMPL